ncbi:MAG: hypothetical protein AAF465_01575 [Pseudomonadota bacterium]
MTSTASSAARTVSFIALMITLFLLLGLFWAGVKAFDLVIAPPEPEARFVFVLLTAWLVLVGVVGTITGLVGMKLAAGAPKERQRCWYAVAVGLVSVSIGATFGVGFV